MRAAEGEMNHTSIVVVEVMIYEEMSPGPLLGLVD